MQHEGRLEALVQEDKVLEIRNAKPLIEADCDDSIDDSILIHKPMLEAEMPASDRIASTKSRPRLAASTAHTPTL